MWASAYRMMATSSNFMRDQYRCSPRTPSIELRISDGYERVHSQLVVTGQVAQEHVGTRRGQVDLARLHDARCEVFAVGRLLDSRSVLVDVAFRVDRERAGRCGPERDQ